MKLIIDLKELNGNPRNIYGQAMLFKKGATYYLVSYETVVLTYSAKKRNKAHMGWL